MRLATANTSPACLVSAQNPYSSSNPYSSGSNPYTSSSGTSSSSSSNSSYGSNLTDFPSLRLIHGVLASLAFVFFFPVGAIIIRVLPSRFAIWIHAAFQVIAYLLFIAAAAIGIHLGLQVKSASRGYFNMVSCTTLHEVRTG